ncbi:MAG: hypothetical protein LBD20_03315 [Spirochaetaceae bacterium]|nr:hypothetical protein [Spirochaetaceae bacterium]
MSVSGLTLSAWRGGICLTVFEFEAGNKTAGSSGMADRETANEEKRMVRWEQKMSKGGGGG